MPKLKYKKSYIGLSKYDVYKIDNDINSEYFNISSFPDVFTSGKNYFLISGTDKLKPNTNVIVEIIDSRGNTIYNDIPDILINGTDRAICVYVYDDTPYGLCKITILGELQDAPPEWNGKYNVKWERTVLVNPTLPDIDGAIFINNPSVTVSEIYDISGSLTTKIYEPIIQTSGSISGSFYGDENFAGTDYVIKIQDGEFNTNMLGGQLYISASNMSILTDNSSQYTTIDYSCSIVNVINSQMAVVNVPYILKNNVTNVYKKHQFVADVYYLYYNSPITSSIGSGGTQGSGIGTNVIKSYLDIKLDNLSTYIGNIKYVDLYKQPGNIFIGRYPLDSINELKSGSQFTSINDFTENWTYVTSSEFNISYDNNILINSIKFENATTGSDNYVVNNYQVPVLNNTEYEVFFKFQCKTNLYNRTPSLSVFLSGSAITSTMSTGLLLSRITPNNNTFLTFRKNFIPSNNGHCQLKLKFDDGDWNISDVKISPYKDSNFSVGHTNIIVESPTSNRNENVSIQTTFIDGGGNVVGDSKQTTNTGGKNIDDKSYIPVSSSNMVISHDDNLIEGSLFVGSKLRSGIHISGDENGIPASMVRSVGYEGYIAGYPGFIIYSGSVLSGSGNNYNGVGLEMLGSSGSFRFHANGPSDSFIEVITDKFFLGHPSSQYISGANGLIEISSSQFILSSSGEAIFKGLIQASTGSIGDWKIINGLLSGSNITMDADRSKIYNSNLEQDYFIIFNDEELQPDPVTGFYYYVKFGDNFAISSSGQVIVSGAQAVEVISSSNGIIGGFTVHGNGYYKLVGSKYAGANSSGSYLFFADSMGTNDNIISASYYVRNDGQIKASSLLIAGTASQAGTFYSGSTNPTDSGSRVNYNGEFYATKVYNAVFNDIVDFFEVSMSYHGYKPGYVYTKVGEYAYRSTEYAQKNVIGITSDTFGIGIGRKNIDNELPIAVAGITLAYVDMEYEMGTPLTCTKGGKLTEFKHNDKIQFPERMYATYYKPEKSDEWHGINVNGRHWVRVK